MSERYLRLTKKHLDKEKDSLSSQLDRLRRLRGACDLKEMRNGVVEGGVINAFFRIADL